jgi:cellulose synthase operon protein C
MNATTVKRLAILIAVLSLLGGITFIAHEIQVKRLGENVIKEAKTAIEKGDFAKAEMRFRDYLRVFPAELEIQIAHADTLLKVSQSLTAQYQALQTYNNVLKQSLGRLDVRRKLMQLKIDMGRFISTRGQVDGADFDLKILLEASSPSRTDFLSSTDGDLQFLLGRCYEENKEDPSAPANAVSLYLKAIENKATQRIEAGERCATILRDKLQQPKKAEQVINSLVENSPQDYRGYLARGRWRAVAARDQSQKSLALDAEKDFKKARALAPSQPEVYLQLAKVAMDKSKPDYNEARRILEDGLKHASSSHAIYFTVYYYVNASQFLKARQLLVKLQTAIYEALAKIEISDGKIDDDKIDKAIEYLERGLKSQPDQSSLRLFLTDLLARRGDTGNLLLQIEELRNRGYSQLLTNYFTAYYYVNTSQFLKARQLLVKIQTAKARISDAKFNSRINVLLSQCYKELGEPEMQQNAYLQALSADPQDPTAKLGWIANLLNQGDITGAIKEYRALAKNSPVVRPILAQLLIEQNQRRPESQRNWNEVEELINQATQTAPESVQPVVLRAKLLFAQGKETAAHDILQDAQRRFPKSVEVRVAQAEGLQGRIDDALKLLDQAQQELGDQVDLRLERARLWTFKKGPQFLKVLMDLSQDAQKFSKADRKRLLNGLAGELERQQDLEGASVLLTRLADEDETNLVLRRNLLDLALKNANKDEIEKNIKQIEAIEGNEGLMGRYCQIRYLIWQAKRATDKDMREAIHSKARKLLDDLKSRRGDWSVIPLASAELAEQELAQSNLTKDQIQAIEERIIGFLLQAINLGQRHAAVVRPAVQLLFKHGRANNALELLSSIPLESQLGHQAAWIAIENRDFQHAEQIARTAVAAKPDDFQERLWLVQILLASERLAEAAKELREAVGLSPSDPDRWITFVTFMIFTKQPGEAEKIIKEAETKLPPLRAPLALASCCEKIAEMYGGSGNGIETKKWNDAATNWYKKAEAAQPEDLSIKRRLTEFFLRSKQIDEAHKYLEAMRKQNGGAKNAETAAWANRALALVLASGSDRTQLSKALTLFEPDGQPVPAGQEGKKRRGDPEDQRVLARVLDVQKTVVQRKRAIEILESLADQNLATSEDRFILAHLYEVIGDWPKARQKYDELNLRTKSRRDIETLNRRPIYLAQFTRSLLQHHKPGDEQDLIDAQELVDEIKQLQPNDLGALILQIEIYRNRNEINKATELIQVFANRPSTTPQALEALADLAERMERFDLSEALYQRMAGLANARGKILLAAFLGRQNKVDKALNVCEPLWKSIREVEVLGITCINILFGSNDHPRTPEPAQINRVVAWFDQAISVQVRNQQRPNTWLFIGLGNLREKQGNYSEAKRLYLLAADGDHNGISYNNLAWLAALKDGKVEEALEYANHAIALKPDQADFLDTRGMIYLAAGKRELALDDLQKAVANDPLSPFKHYHLAQAFLAINNKEKARESLETAKAKGFTPNGLDVLEQPSYPNFLKELGSP